jgi:predicted transcriptional regulator
VHALFWNIFCDVECFFKPIQYCVQMSKRYLRITSVAPRVAWVSSIEQAAAFKARKEADVASRLISESTGIEEQDDAWYVTIVEP